MIGDLLSKWRGGRLLDALGSGDAVRASKLLASGADANAKGARRASALSLACWRRASLNLVEALIAAGADIDAKDDAGWTPLMYAVAADNAEASGLLIASGCRVDDKGLPTVAEGHGQTALMMAAFRDSSRCAADGHGQTPLICASRSKRGACIGLLL